MGIIDFIGAHWTEWLFSVLLAVLGWLVNMLRTQLKKEQEQSGAIAEGVKSLLRDNIIKSYNKYSERGYCPIYSKKSLEQIYAAYHRLGGNDVATELYMRLLKMPTEGQNENKEENGKETNKPGSTT